MIPSPSRLTMCPPASSSGGSTACAACRNSVSAASSPACNDHAEKPTRSVKTSVTLGFAGRRETASVSACHTWSAPRLTSRDAASRSPSIRPAARAAARGPPSPAVDSRSPNSGSPGNARRARRISSTTPGLWFVLRSHCAAVCIDTRERRRCAAGTAAVATSSGSPGAGSKGPSFTRSRVEGSRRRRQRTCRGGGAAAQAGDDASRARKNRQLERVNRLITRLRRWSRRRWASFQIRIPKPKFVLMPTPVCDQLFKPFVAGQRWIAAGLFDPAVREKAGMRWTPGDEVLLRLFGKLVELLFLAVPDEIRLHPRALAAYRRAEGRIPPDAPLVEAPSFVAPPRDRRGLPMHYFPPRRTIMEHAGSAGAHHLLAGRPAARPRPRQGRVRTARWSTVGARPLGRRALV